MKFVCSLTWIITVIIGMNLSFRAVWNDGYCARHLHTWINDSDVSLIDMIFHRHYRASHILTGALMRRAELKRWKFFFCFFLHACSDVSRTSALYFGRFARNVERGEPSHNLCIRRPITPTWTHLARSRRRGEGARVLLFKITVPRPSTDRCKRTQFYWSAFWNH